MSVHGNARVAWLFLAPALALIAVFFFLPVAAALLLSFTDFDIYAVGNFDNARFIGLQGRRGAERETPRPLREDGESAPVRCRRDSARAALIRASSRRP